MRTAELSVEEKSTDRGAVIEVIGEVDLTTVSLLREPLLSRVSKNPASNVIVDLTRVDFIDSAGLALLVEARKRLATDGRSLYLIIAPGRQPERVLRLVRFDTIMKLVYGLQEVSAMAESQSS
jgi:anti-anti-sigma factor